MGVNTSQSFLPMPDIEAVCGKAVRNANTVLGKRVYSSKPATPVFPMARIIRAGGRPPVRQKLDMARIQVDVWAETKDQARDAADAARLAIFALEGTADVGNKAFVTAVEDELGGAFMPDADTTRDRYFFSLMVFAHYLGVT